MPNKRTAGTKECLVCQKQFEAYRKNNTYCSDYCRWQARHLTRTVEEKEKRASRTAEWGQKKKDHRRNYQLKYTYGITLEKYYEILKSQNDCCAVCNKHISQENRLFAVDHDHKTGEIFGILCNYCNRQVIGRIRKPEIFLAAAKYLEKGLGLFAPKKKKRKKR
jgi:hypothetical protein